MMTLGVNMVGAGRMAAALGMVMLTAGVARGQVNYDTPYTFVTLAGTARVPGHADGLGTNAQFAYIASVAVDKLGNVFVADDENGLTRKVTPSGLVTTWADTGFYSLTVDGAENVYGTFDNSILKIAPDRTVTPLAGGNGGMADGTNGAAEFAFPTGITVDSATNLFVCDSGNESIRKVSSAGANWVVTTIAGTNYGYEQTSYPSEHADGTNGAARFAEPIAIAWDGTANLYVADWGSSTVRRISPQGTNWMTTTIGGIAWAGGSADGPYGSSQFGSPAGVAVDQAGGLIVADGGNCTIRRISLAGTNFTTTTLAGLAGVAGVTDGTGSDARFMSPGGVAVDLAGNVYVADVNSATIRVGYAANSPVLIATQPAGATVAAGGAAAIQVLAGGTPPLSYQWLRNGTNVPGAVLNPLALSDAQAGDAGEYSVVITNAFGSVTSSVATLVIMASAPIITIQPQSQTVTNGDPLVLRVGAQGTEPLAYQWRENGINVTGATQSTYALTNTPAEAGGNYDVIVTNAFGSATSAVAVLTVDIKPSITVQPVSQTVMADGSVVFTAAASGPAPLVYQWETNGVPVAGATTGSYVLTNVPYAVNGLNLALLAMNGSGCVTSSVAVLTVLSAPIIESEPESVATTNGGTVTFNVGVSGTGPFTYQWELNGTNLPGAKGSGFTLTNVQPQEVGLYQVVAFNAYGSVTSSVAALTLALDLEPYAFTTLAGVAGEPGRSDGTNGVAQFNDPNGVAVDGAGNVYVADTGNNTIRKVSPTGVVTTLAGLAGVAGSADGTNSDARFNHPYGVTVDNSGVVYVADSYNHTIRKITPDGLVSTLAGQPGAFGRNDGTNGTAQFNYPFDVATDRAGNIYVADLHNDTIRKVTPGGSVTTLAGEPGNIGYEDGASGEAQFFYPDGVTVDETGNVYVADYINCAIRGITPAGQVFTLGGLARNPGDTDGYRSGARFNYPGGLAVDRGGNVFVPDIDNNTIRKLTPAGLVSTLAGVAGLAGSEDGTGSAARFNEPGGVTVDSAGNVYVVDSLNHTLRRGYPAGGAPMLTSVAMSGGRMGFQIAGPAGQVVVVQASADLASWQPVWTNTVGAGALVFQDPQPVASQSSRYYRAVKQ